MLNWLVIWREINILLALFGFGLVVLRLWQLRQLWSIEERYFAGANAIFTIAAAATSLDGIVYGLPFGWRVPLLTLAAAWLIYSTIQKPPQLRFRQSEQRVDQ